MRAIAQYFRNGLSHWELQNYGVLHEAYEVMELIYNITDLENGTLKSLFNGDELEK